MCVCVGLGGVGVCMCVCLVCGGGGVNGSKLSSNKVYIYTAIIAAGAIQLQLPFDLEIPK